MRVIGLATDTPVQGVSVGVSVGNGRLFIPYHVIDHAVVVLVTGEAETAQDGTEVLFADGFHGLRIGFGQVGIDFCCGLLLEGLVGLRVAEVAQDEVLDGLDDAETHVHSSEHGLFVVRQVARSALGDALQTFGVELGVVDGRFHVNHLRNLHADEASVACGVGEQAEVVARADERGQTGQLGEVVLVVLLEGE